MDPEPTAPTPLWAGSCAPPNARAGAWPLDGRGLISARGRPSPAPPGSQGRLRPHREASSQEPCCELDSGTATLDGSRTSGVPLKQGLRPARQRAARASHIPKELALPCPPLLHRLRPSPSTPQTSRSLTQLGTLGMLTTRGQGAVCTAPACCPWAHGGQCAPQCASRAAGVGPLVLGPAGARAPRGHSRGGVGEEAPGGGASAETRRPDGEQSLAPRPGHVWPPGVSWAGGPPRCPSKQAEVASFWG